MLNRIVLVLAILHFVASFIPRNGPCIPGELVWVECNLCTCTQRGMPNLICANMWCQPQPKAKGLTTEMPFEGEEEDNYEVDNNKEDNETI